MISNRSMPPGTIVPVLEYADVGEAVAWLCRAFGFTERLRIGEHRSQLCLGEASVVVARSATALRQVSDAARPGHSVMVRVPDVDAHFRQAQACGASMLGGPEAHPYGERQYSAVDPGGHVWTFSQSLFDADPEAWGGELRSSAGARPDPHGITMHDVAAGTFVPMLESLVALLDKGAAHAAAAQLDLVNARLAPDMFTLAQQVQQACHYARDCTSRLTGRDAATMQEVESTFAGLKAQIARTLDFVRAATAAAFAGAEERDCSIEIPGEMVIEMNGLQLLRSWSLPHFYFHVVTAYDILRHHGVQIGKRDYLSQVAGFIRPGTK